MYNFLGFPVGAMPVSKVVSADIDLMENYPTHDRQHRLMKEVRVEKVTYYYKFELLYSPESNQVFEI